MRYILKREHWVKNGGWSAEAAVAKREPQRAFLSMLQPSPQSHWRNSVLIPTRPLWHMQRGPSGHPKPLLTCSSHTLGWAHGMQLGQDIRAMYPRTWLPLRDMVGSQLGCSWSWLWSPCKLWTWFWATALDKEMVRRCFHQKPSFDHQLILFSIFSLICTALGAQSPTHSLHNPLEVTNTY